MSAIVKFDIQKHIKQMKIAEYKSLGLKVKLSVPASVEEFDTNAKRAGACLDEATNNCVYRGSLAEFRDTLCDAVEAKYAVDRKTKDTGKKDANGNPISVYDETEADFVSRVVSTKGIKVEDLQPIADTVAAKIVFDASARERKPAAPKKLSQKIIDAATKLLASKDKWKEFNTRAAKTLGKQFEFKADTTAEQLGWFVKEYVDAQQAALLGGITG